MDRLQSKCFPAALQGETVCGGRALHARTTRSMWKSHRCETTRLELQRPRAGRFPIGRSPKLSGQCREGEVADDGVSARSITRESDRVQRVTLQIRAGAGESGLRR